MIGDLISRLFQTLWQVVNFLTSWASTSLSRTALFHGVTYNVIYV